MAFEKKNTALQVAHFTTFLAKRDTKNLETWICYLTPSGPLINFKFEEGSIQNCAFIRINQSALNSYSPNLT